MEKKGQVTIFIIIAIIIVVAGVLIYAFYPQIKSSLGGEIKNPQSFIQGCVEEEIEDAVEMVSLQGGSVEPGYPFLYIGENLEYLCYASVSMVPCVVQQPLLEQHIESEIENYINGTVGDCFDSLESNYERRGYNIEVREENFNVDLLPKQILTSFNHKVTMTKGESSETYDSFRVVLSNNLYELVAIANSIIELERTVGHAEPLIYMEQYNHIIVQEPVLGVSDGTTVYIIKDKNTGDLFQFASRSWYSYLI